jgi:hypothetical protein
MGYWNGKLASRKERKKGQVFKFGGGRTEKREKA